MTVTRVSYMAEKVQPREINKLDFKELELGVEEDNRLQRGTIFLWW